jgi:nitroimidazol reductase NimA-like FMN-containing flavoprotein (pyridoxamine 5'-phosphate oxidase superfamily)
MSKNYDLEHTPPTSMRRPERAQDDAWIREFLGRAGSGYIATRWEDQPFITPMNFWYDPERHEIYFHSNITGRMRANSERYPQVCFAASEMGRLLPSNLAGEFSVQFESVIAFGRIRVVTEPEEARRALYGLIAKHFPGMQPGEQYRPIMDAELARTSVYAIAIDGWTGKRNWPEQAVQSPDWPALAPEWFK